MHNEIWMGRNEQGEYFIGMGPAKWLYDNTQKKVNGQPQQMTWRNMKVSYLSTRVAEMMLFQGGGRMSLDNLTCLRLNFIPQELMKAEEKPDTRN